MQIEPVPSEPSEPTAASAPVGPFASPPVEPEPDLGPEPELGPDRDQVALEGLEAELAVLEDELAHVEAGRAARPDGAPR
jgi:hypothetical protein